jgi:hypothetical protein
MRTNFDVGVAIARALCVTRTLSDFHVFVVIARIGRIARVSDNGEVMVVVAISNAVTSPTVAFSVLPV